MFFVMNPMLWSLTPADDVTLFFALKPPPDLAREIARRGAIVRGAHALRGHAMGAERLHVTLACCHQGRDGLDDAIRRAVAAGDALRQGGFPISFDRTESFNHGGGRYPFVLRGAEGLEDAVGFRAALCGRMRRAGFAVTGGFTPHVTLAWADRIVAPHPTAPIGWRADELLLVESPVGRSRHRHVARWPLH